jgi:nucleoside-diphosphate-sugar epimerase
MTYTVLGAEGFIGKQLCSFLQQVGVEVFAPLRGESSQLLEVIASRELGHVFYCIGLTADFRDRPFDTVEAHVCLLRSLLRNGRFDTLTYLSSTRVYDGAETTDEATTLRVRPTDPSHVYNLSKLMGESLCFNGGRRTRIVRLSNVYGNTASSSNFLDSVFQDAVQSGEVTFRSAPESAKDYVFVEDVIRWLYGIATDGKSSIYNVARGENVSNAEIGRALSAAGVRVRFACNGPTIIFPVIRTERLFDEFGPPKHDLRKDLPEMLSLLRAKNFP